MSVHIRRAQAQDANAIADLLRSLGWFAHLKAETVEATRDRVVRHLDLCHSDNSHSLYVAESESGVVGYLAIHWMPYLFLPGPEGYISELIICDSARDQGIGTQLLETAKQEAVERGCSRLMLLNNRSRESYKRRFYEKHGWQEREQMANFVYLLV